MYIKLHGKIYAETKVEDLSAEQLMEYATEEQENKKQKVIKLKGKFYVLCNIGGMSRAYLEQALNDVIVQTDKELDEERGKRSYNDFNKSIITTPGICPRPSIIPNTPVYPFNQDDMFKWDPTKNPVWCTTTKTCSNNQDVLVIDMSAHALPENPCIPSCWLADTYMNNQQDTQNFLNKTIR